MSMMFIPKRIGTWLTICLVVGIVGIGLAGYRAYDLMESRRALVRDAKQAARQEAKAAAGERNRRLRIPPQKSKRKEALPPSLRSNSYGCSSLATSTSTRSSNGG